MKALSLWQPWAFLWSHSPKCYETRHWYFSYRGELVVHAAKRWTSEERLYCEQPVFAEALKRYGCFVDKMPLGCALGIVNIVDCVKITESFINEISEEEYAFGNYTPGRYAIIADTFKPFATPIPMKGAQGLFDVPADMVNFIQAAPLKFIITTAAGAKQ